MSDIYINSENLISESSIKIEAVIEFDISLDVSEEVVPSLELLIEAPPSIYYSNIHLLLDSIISVESVIEFNGSLTISEEDIIPSLELYSGGPPVFHYGVSSLSSYFSITLEAAIEFNGSLTVSEEVVPELILTVGAVPSTHDGQLYAVSDFTILVTPSIVKFSTINDVSNSTIIVTSHFEVTFSSLLESSSNLIISPEVIRYMSPTYLQETTDVNVSSYLYKFIENNSISYSTLDILSSIILNSNIEIDSSSSINLLPSLDKNFEVNISSLSALNVDAFKWIFLKGDYIEDNSINFSFQDEEYFPSSNFNFYSPYNLNITSEIFQEPTVILGGKSDLISSSSTSLDGFKWIYLEGVYTELTDYYLGNQSDNNYDFDIEYSLYSEVNLFLDVSLSIKSNIEIYSSSSVEVSPGLYKNFSSNLTSILSIFISPTKDIYIDSTDINSEVTIIIDSSVESTSVTSFIESISIIDVVLSEVHYLNEGISSSSILDIDPFISNYIDLVDDNDRVEFHPDEDFLSSSGGYTASNDPLFETPGFIYNPTIDSIIDVNLSIIYGSIEIDLSSTLNIVISFSPAVYFEVDLVSQSNILCFASTKLGAILHSLAPGIISIVPFLERSADITINNYSDIYINEDILHNLYIDLVNFTSEATIFEDSEVIQYIDSQSYINSISSILVSAEIFRYKNGSSNVEGLSLVNIESSIDLYSNSIIISNLLLGVTPSIVKFGEIILSSIGSLVSDPIVFNYLDGEAFLLETSSIFIDEEVIQYVDFVSNINSVSTVNIDPIIFQYQDGEIFKANNSSVIVSPYIILSGDKDLGCSSDLFADSSIEKSFIVDINSLSFISVFPEVVVYIDIELTQLVSDITLIITSNVIQFVDFQVDLTSDSIILIGSIVFQYENIFKELYIDSVLNLNPYQEKFANISILNNSIININSNIELNSSFNLLSEASVNIISNVVIITEFSSYLSTFSSIDITSSLEHNENGNIELISYSNIDLIGSVNIKEGVFLIGSNLDVYFVGSKEIRFQRAVELESNFSINIEGISSSTIYFESDITSTSQINISGSSNIINFESYIDVISYININIKRILNSSIEIDNYSSLLVTPSPILREGSSEFEASSSLVIDSSVVEFINISTLILDSYFILELSASANIRSGNSLIYSDSFVFIEQNMIHSPSFDLFVESSIYLDHVVVYHTKFIVVEELISTFEIEINPIIFNYHDGIISLYSNLSININPTTKILDGVIHIEGNGNIQIEIQKFISLARSMTLSLESIVECNAYEERFSNIDIFPIAELNSDPIIEHLIYSSFDLVSEFNISISGSSNIDDLIFHDVSVSEMVVSAILEIYSEITIDIESDISISYFLVISIENYLQVSSSIFIDEEVIQYVDSSVENIISRSFVYVYGTSHIDDGVLHADFYTNIEIDPILRKYPGLPVADSGIGYETYSRFTDSGIIPPTVTSENVSSLMEDRVSGPIISKDKTKLVASVSSELKTVIINDQTREIEIQVPNSPTPFFFAARLSKDLMKYESSFKVMTMPEFSARWIDYHSEGESGIKELYDTMKGFNFWYGKGYVSIFISLADVITKGRIRIEAKINREESIDYKYVEFKIVNKEDLEEYEDNVDLVF